VRNHQTLLLLVFISPFFITVSLIVCLLQVRQALY